MFAGGLKLLAQNLLNRSRTHLEASMMREKHRVLMMGCVSKVSEGPPRAGGHGFVWANEHVTLNQRGDWEWGHSHTWRDGREPTGCTGKWDSADGEAGTVSMETQEVTISLMDWARSTERDPLYTCPKYQSTPHESVSITTLPVL